MQFIDGKRLNVRLSSVLFFILIFIMPPAFFSNINLFDFFNKILIILIFIILVILTTVKRRINSFVLLSFIFIGWNSMSSYLLAGGVLDLFNNLKILSFILIINIMVKNKTLSLLRSLNLLFGFYIVLNFLSYIIFPEGLYIDNPRGDQYRAAWFLGIENQFAYFIIPGIIIVLLYSWYRFEKINLNSFIIVILSGVTIIISWSATAVVSYFFVVVSFVFVLWKGINKLYNFYLLLSTYIVVWLLIVKANSFSILKQVIEDILNKDMTFSSRTLIWEKIFELIPLSKWYGFGNNTSVLVFTTKEFRAHNMFLQIIIDNGIIGALIFSFIILIVGFKMSEHRGNIMIFLLLIGIFGILIGGLTESYRLNNLFMILTLSYNCSLIIKSHQSNRVNKPLILKS